MTVDTAQTWILPSGEIYAAKGKSLTPTVLIRELVDSLPSSVGLGVWNTGGADYVFMQAGVWDNYQVFSPPQAAWIYDGRLALRRNRLVISNCRAGHNGKDQIFRVPGGLDLAIFPDPTGDRRREFAELMGSGPQT